MNNTVTLPWPDKRLHPNTRTDRRHTTAVRKEYRNTCWRMCKYMANLDPALTHLDITFHPPDARRRDLDNMLGAIKYGLDGMAMALGVDDYDWSLTIRRGEKDAEKQGKVVIRLLSQSDVAHIPYMGTID